MTSLNAAAKAGAPHFARCWRYVGLGAKRLLFAIVAMLLLSIAAHAQTTQILANHIAYFGGQVANGQFCVIPTDSGGNGINLTTPAGQQLAPTQSLCYPIVNGVLSSAATVPDTSQTNPVNACLKATITDTHGNVRGVYPCLQPSGATWSFDAYVPSSLPAIPAIALPQFELNGTPLLSQSTINYQCPGCTNIAGGNITLPVGGNAIYSPPGGIAYSFGDKLSQSISIKDYGAFGDGAHMAVDSAALVAAVSQAAIAGQRVYIPAGVYLLDNSTAPALSGPKNVILYGDGPASVLSCQTVGGQDCIASTAATGFGLKDLAVNFGPTAAARTSGYALDVQSCTNCTFDGVTLNNGDLSGFRLASSTHTTIRNLATSNFYANGLFAINDQDLRLDGESCTNNQDACFEVSWYDSQYSTYGVPCQDIAASNINSNNDTEAVLINACNNVSVDGFTALNSGKESVFIGQDPTTTTGHWPDRIAISNGTIYGAGYGTNANNAATAQALYINVGTAPPAGTISHISIANISATHISGWGLAMADLQTDDVQLSNSTFHDVGSGNAVGCLQTEGNEVNLTGVFCSKSGTYGLYDTDTNRLTGAGLNFNASSQVSGIDAIYLSTTAVGFVNLSNVSVHDTNTTTFSSEIYDASTTGLQHTIWNISTTYVTATGYLAPTAANSATTYTYTDPGHSMVFRNGGMIQSFVPPNYYFLPTAGATPTSYVNGAVLYYQSKCWSGGAQQTESIGWLDLYPTLTTESLAINKTGGCGFPLVFDVTAAATVQANAVTATSYNNIAFPTPAALATFTILSGQSFTVAKTMTLTCTTCGTYNLDSLGSGGGSGAVVNGVSYSAAYPQSTLVARINAACTDAANGTNGNTSHKCDSTGEADTQSDTTGTTIAIGNSSAAQVVWIHPPTCHWSLSGYTGGTADLVDLYGGSSIEGPTPVNNPCEIFYLGGTNGAYAVFQTITTTTGSNTYFKVKGMGFQDSHAALASGATAVFNTSSDGSVFEDLLITNYQAGQSAILLNDAQSYGPCCTTTFNRVVANGNYSSGPILKILGNGSNGQSSVEFTNVSLTHPGVGYPVIQCSSTNQNGESLYFDNLYEESNRSDTTTPVNQVNGCLAIKVSGQTVSDPGATTSSSAPIWQFSGTLQPSFDLSGLTAVHGFVAPAIAVQNNISGYNCASTPCNVMTDANGNLGHYTNATFQGDVINASVGFEVAGSALAVANVAGAAPLASPAFTGTPTAPTQPISTNNTDIATTAAVASIFTAAGAASKPALNLSGAPYTGGSATTTFPLSGIICAAATAVTTWSTAGTQYGMDTCSGFTGNLADWYVNNVRRFRVDYAGNLFSGGTATFSSTVIAPALLPSTLYSAAGTALPTCAVALKGQMAAVSDATSPTYMGAYASGGAITAAVICSYNGTTYAWLTH